MDNWKWFYIWTQPNRDAVEKCGDWSKNITQQIDLAFNIFFMVYFFIRVRSSKPNYSNALDLVFMFEENSGLMFLMI